MAKSCDDKIPNNRANIREKIDHFIEALEELLFNDEDPATPQNIKLRPIFMLTVRIEL